MTMQSETVRRDFLTQQDAEARAARVSDCSYELGFELQRGSPTYRGDVTIRFAQAGSGDLFLDFRGTRVDRLEVNGRRQEPRWAGYQLWLPGDVLSSQNTVRVVYENEYDHSGDGFHQFIDPEDGEEYLYSNFEPYEAHRLFPCFDQPDLKATYGLTVIAPAEWQVVANTAVSETAATGDGRTRHSFPRTQPFSTYLFALIVGPYHVARQMHGDVDMGLYCRKSLVPYLDTDELFLVTGQGLDFFGNFFDYPYPWGKYDQVFVPEFNSGAMENVAAVTHNEYMVYRDPPTDNQRRLRAETVLHEMAHMWFGDLVTMRWWNDLWLNESFATYMAYLCLTQATRFETGWQDFNASMKNWAYRQDQLVTTHPIAGEVADTDQTFLNFDGITYAKGASVLKQLAAAIGPEGFREGMRQYFRKYAFQNATLAQFLGALEQGSGRDLKEWARLWLETASLNTISAEWQADGERLAALTLRQAAPAEYPTIRPHRLDIGLLREKDRSIETTVLAAEIDGESADIPEARGLPRPDLVLPNYNDLAYAKVALDEASVAFVRERIDRIEDLLTRSLLWSSLWNMVRDQQLASRDFLSLVRTKIPHELSTELVDSVLGQALTALARYVPDEHREAEAHALFETAWRALGRSLVGDAKIIWARTLCRSALAPDDVLRATRLADGEETLPGVTIDQDMRWDLAARWASLNLPGWQERVAAELERDPSDRGQRARLRCETAEPNAAVKAAAWEKFNGEGYGSQYLTSAAMGGFLWWRQRELLEPYVERFFTSVTAIFASREKEYASEYFRALFPTHVVEQRILERSQTLLASTGEDLPMLRRMLREANDDLQRSIRCRAYDAS